MNYKSPISHHYLLFEYDDVGYVLRYLKGSNVFEKADKKKNKLYYQIFTMELEGFSNQEIIDDLNYLTKYKIKSFKEEVKCYLDKSPPVLFSSISKGNAFYYLCIDCRIEDFSKLTRYDASRKLIHFSGLIDIDGMEVCEAYYMN